MRQVVIWTNPTIQMITVSLFAVTDAVLRTTLSIVLAR